LLAGERLYLDVKRMEMAYLDLNQREYELIKHVSLLQLDPLALVRLRATGRCTFTIPEVCFDMDSPGHYFRRIKNVALTIPSVTGPYASVNSTLTLIKSSIRKRPALSDGVYPRVNAEDDRFNDYFGSLQSIVTSSAQNDSGMFETNLGDERYLPFELSGAISEWQLELPADPSKGEPQQFDYNTISDVILHMRYTARQGGELLRKAAIDTINDLIGSAQASGSTRLFSVRQEFPNEWASFQHQTPSPSERYALTLKLTDAHYPFWSQGRLQSVPRVDLLAHSTRAPIPGSLDVFEKVEKTDPNGAPVASRKDTLVKDPAMNLLVGRFTDNANGLVLPAKPVTEIKLFFDEDPALSDFWLAVTWSSAQT
jgi:Tc toxin complex TcA C-terminal TcB-binding domain